MRVEGHQPYRNEETPLFVIQEKNTSQFFLSINSVMVFIREKYPELELNKKLRYGKKKIGWEVSLLSASGELKISCIAAYKAVGRSDRGRPRKTQN